MLLDGRDVREYSLRDLRRQLSLVSQDVVLFDDSIANNIAYGALEGSPRAAIERAAEAAYVAEFAAELPEGLETRIGERGAMLSGGQRQRIAIARALLKDAPVLILDEATSALDTESERRVQAALSRLMQGRTTLVIAHRLSTIEKADLIIVMREGAIVERATHAELDRARRLLLDTEPHAVRGVVRCEHARRLALAEALWYGDNPLRFALFPFAFVYRSIAQLRRAAYRRGVLKTVELPVPVVVVGNVSVGGTGKTPFVIWLAGQLQQRNLRVGIVTRGYRGSARDWPRVVDAKSDPHEVGDEPVLLARRTGCPVVAGPDRVAAAQRLLAEHRLDAVISDDGLQHYRLGRRFEIAVVDGVRGMGNGLCLPAGPLREPAARINEVDAIVVNGGDWGHAGVFRAKAVVTSVYRVSNREPRTLESFKGASVHAVAGIGNPQRFFDLLDEAGLDVMPHPLEDHAEIGPDQLTFDEPGAVLITEKDAVKCESIAHANVWCVVVDLSFDADKTARLMRLVLRDLEGRAP